MWLAAAAAAALLWAFVTLLLLPGVRWFMRRRINRLTAALNERLHLRIPPIAMTRREVQRYAREIVPAFNAFVYFSLANRLARGFVNLLYRVRLGHADRRALRLLPPTTSVVFVMNHRSNVDYILVAYLASKRVTLSYAVGEWARVWPIQQVIRSLGAYFVRRGSGNDMYRRVLERYVQMAIDGGAVQAIFPEGGLSRDGLMRTPRLGLLDYMLRHFDPQGERDIAFVPVGLNYDRVLEDRTLLVEAANRESRRTGLAALGVAVKFLLLQFWLRLRGRWFRFGYACANFGTPILLKEYLATAGWSPAGLGREARGERVQQFADHLMAAVGRVVPVLPVSLVASVFVAATEALDESEINARALALQQRCEAIGAQVYVPRSDPEYSVLVGLRMLTLRKLVIEEAGRFRANPHELELLRYYANAIAHLAS